jgi:hypothetical protein
MSGYTINGYILALRIRTKHTICAEGKDDNIVIKHCLLKLLQDHSKLHDNYVIDTAEIIQSDGTTPGNIDKLKKIHQLISGTSTSDKVSIIVDREYTEFDLSNNQIDKKPEHIQESSIMWFTRGHSIENYFFESEYFIDYLETQYPTELCGNYRELIRSNWQHILTISASLTYSIHENRLCTKCKNLFSYKDWNMGCAKTLHTNKIHINSQLISRGIQQAQIDSIINRADQLYIQFEAKPAAKWVIHGHLGLDLLSGAIGGILKFLGVSESTCNNFDGYSNIKFKHLMSEWYINSNSNDDVFPTNFFRRIQSALGL